MKRPEAKIDNLSVRAYRILTDFPESDGTLEWNSTTIVVATAQAAGKTGLGYTYADAGAAWLIRDLLAGADKSGFPVYGSGGFTSYDDARLCRQLAGWAEQGMTRVKMKIGRDPQRDLERVRAARRAIGSGVELFVDANGAYSRKQALWFAEEFAGLGVTWFE